MKTHCAFTANWKQTIKHFRCCKILSALPGSTPAPIQASPMASGQVFLVPFAILCLSVIAALLCFYFCRAISSPSSTIANNTTFGSFSILYLNLLEEVFHKNKPTSFTLLIFSSTDFSKQTASFSYQRTWTTLYWFWTLKTIFALPPSSSWDAVGRIIYNIGRISTLNSEQNSSHLRFLEPPRAGKLETNPRDNIPCLTFLIFTYIGYSFSVITASKFL